jgi:hypothetical protein
MKKIIKHIGLVYLIGFAVITLLYHFAELGYGFIQASFYAGFLNLLNSAFAILFFELSFNKSNKDFFVMNLGGMGLRIFFLLIAVFLFIKFLNIDKIAFILLFFIFYFILLIVEINHFRLKANSKT